MNKLMHVGMFLLLAILGCAANPMVGVWKLQLPDIKDPRIEGTSGEAVFLRDNSFTMTITTKAAQSESKFELKGTYRLEGKELVLQIVEATVDAVRQPDQEDSILRIRVSDDMKSFGHPSVTGARFVRE